MARVTTSSSPLMALCLRSCIPTPSLCRRVLNRGGRPSEWESEPLKHIGPGLLRALVLPLLFALIHLSAWNRISANFAFWAFCELRLYGVLGSSSSASNAQVTPKIAHLSDTPPDTGVCYACY